MTQGGHPTCFSAITNTVNHSIQCTVLDGMLQSVHEVGGLMPCTLVLNFVLLSQQHIGCSCVMRICCRAGCAVRAAFDAAMMMQTTSEW